MHSIPNKGATLSHQKLFSAPSLVQKLNHYGIVTIYIRVTA